MKILALDLGKNKTVACLYGSDTSEHRFVRVATSPSSLHDLIVDLEPARVVFEIGSSAGWLCDLLEALEISFQVANTAHPTWRWTNTKKKTDRTDALRLAQLSALNQLPQVHVPSQEIRQWRSLIRYRCHLVSRRTQVKNRIRASLDREGESHPAGHRGWNVTAIQTLEGMAKPISAVADDELWRGELWLELQALATISASLRQVETRLDRLAAKQTSYQRLQTIPGVGPRLAEIVVAVLDRPDRFSSGKEVGSYVGLTPRQYQSGDSDRQGRISGHGNHLLRTMLVEVSWAALRCNPALRGVYERARRGSPKRKKIAIVAAARRLLVWCWAMLRDETTWRGSLRATPDA